MKEIDIQEYSWRALENINGFITHAETKATLILGAYGVGLALLIDNFSSIRLTIIHYSVIFALFAICVLSSIISVFYAIKCIFPRLKSTNSGKSKLYFKCIANNYEEEDFIKEYYECIEEREEAIKEIANQIWNNAKIADDKFRDINNSVISFGVSVFAGIILAIIEVLV